MKLVGYIRVSTTGQLDGEGPGVQRDAIKAWCKANGHRLVGFHEEPVTGSSALVERTALPLAMADIDEGTVGGLVVYRLDRLARDLVQQELLLGEIHRAGGSLFSASEVENSYITDDGDPTRVLVRQLLGALAQWEKSMIRMRLKSGRARKAREGGYAYGSPAFGQRSVKGKLVAHEDEHATVARILELRAAGQSYRQIAAVLNSEGRKPKRATSWSAMAVRNIVVRKGTNCHRPPAHSAAQLINASAAPTGADGNTKRGIAPGSRATIMTEDNEAVGTEMSDEEREFWSGDPLTWEEFKALDDEEIRPVRAEDLQAHVNGEISEEEVYRRAGHVK